MVCVCCVEDKNHREDDQQDAEKDVYFGDQQSSGGVECRVLLLYVTLQKDVERRKKICASNETSL